jgi:Transcriptional activator of glycolytic enzymes
MFNQWRYGIEIVAPEDGPVAMITPPVWLLEKHFVQYKGWRHGDEMRQAINKRKVIIYAIVRRMNGLPRTLGDTQPHSRMGEEEAMKDVQAMALSYDGIYKKLSTKAKAGPCGKEMTPKEHEDNWGYGWCL